MNSQTEQLQNITRRHFLHRSGQLSLGAIALGWLFDRDSFAAPPPRGVINPLAPKQPHFAPKVKRVINLHMSGGPPHLDMFDYKPELVKRDGEMCPDEFFKGKRFGFTSATPKLLGTKRTFKQYGNAGMWMSDAIPNFHGIADEIALIKSMHTDEFNHAPAELLLFTGSGRQGRPSMGAWVTYGLGTENEDLPGFIALVSSGTQPSAGQSAWGSGFLPSVFQGCQCRSKGDPVLYLSDPAGMDRNLRRKTLDAMRDLNQAQEKEMGHPETATRIAQYELAFRMQVSAPEVMDISREKQETLDAYGAKPGDASFANNCLLARRLLEKGVRFVQLFDWGWDYHGTDPATGIEDGLTKKCATMDKPVAALLRDLKQRGLLDDTLILWSGEFGRTPFREGRTEKSAILGRDHFPDCFCVWMAGGGVKKGVVYGESDELGFKVGQDPVHVHDLQATILHLLGFDHTKLTFRFQGRDYRLTDVFGKLVKPILA